MKGAAERRPRTELHASTTEGLPAPWAREGITKGPLAYDNRLEWASKSWWSHSPSQVWTGSPKKTQKCLVLAGIELIFLPAAAMFRI